jgi:sigma-B regulation protein RsbU (phosphoserine phosphatase)
MEIVYKLFNKLSKMKLIPLVGISILLLFFIGFINWITGAEISISVFYFIPISICAWFVHKYAGLVLSVLSIIIWFLSDFFNSHSYSHPLVPYWNALVMLVIFASFSLLLSILKNVFDQENLLALNIQKSLLPQKTPEISGYRIFSIWEPTRVVSGDYYDFINLTESDLGISLADVCGHGFPAALLMSNIQATFRIIASHNHSPKEVCDHLNSIMNNYTMPEKFTSFFYGVLNAEKKKFIYTNAGHPPPIILRSTGEIIHLSSGGLLLGVHPDSSYEQSTIQLEKGDILLLYTDGLLETRNIIGEEFGENRMIDFCKKNIHLSAKNFSENILSSLDKFSNNNIDDDISLIVVSVN